MQWSFGACLRRSQSANKTLPASIPLISKTLCLVILLPSITTATISFLTTKDQSIYDHQLPRKATRKGMAIGMLYHKFGKHLKEMMAEGVVAENHLQSVLP